MRSILLCVGIVILTVGGFLLQQQSTASLNTESPAYRAYWMDASRYDPALREEPYTFPNGTLVAGIIPHHLLASHRIAQFILGAAQVTDPSVIVVIGPNHLNRGDQPIATSPYDWETPYGRLFADRSLLTNAVAAHVAGVDEALFSVEHSITAEVAFLRAAFPQARFAPFVIQSTATQTQLDALGEWVAQELPRDALLLVSADFAHDVSPTEADRLDAQSIAALQNLNTPDYDAVTVDSIPAIAVLANYCRTRGAPTLTVLDQANTADVTQESDLTSVTSYILAACVR